MNEETKFSFLLAEKLGMTREELIDRMTISEAMQWAEYLSQLGTSNKSQDMSQLAESLKGFK